MSLLATAASTAIGAASAAAGFGMFLAYLYVARRSEAHAARDEALALAKTRGDLIGDLQRRLAGVEQQLREMTVDCENRVRELERALQKTEDEARENAYRMQKFYVVSLSDLLRDIQADLEKTPPNLERALRRFRELVDDERPAA